jgi:uncharacterized protein YggU (UPF0235/DUF167 family)
MARLHLRVTPAARRTGFVGWYGDVAKLAVAAPPVGGAANEAVIEVLAESLGLRRGQVHLVGGASSRGKRFEIDGITSEQLSLRLAELNPR